MKIKKNLFGIDNLMFILGLTSSMVLLRVKDISFFKWLVILIIIFSLINLFIESRLDVKRIDVHYLLIYFIKIFTIVGALFYSWGSSWKKAAVIQFFWFTLYAILCCFQGIFSEKSIDKFRKGLIISIIVQFMWSIIQYILWNISGIDINTLIFTNILSIVSEASQFKYGVLNVSGLAWHPINMAPILILAYCLFEKWYMKGLTLILALVTNNSTVLIGITVCIILEFFSHNLRRKSEISGIKYKNIITFLIISVVIMIVLLNTDIISKLISSFTYLYGRLTGSYYDGGSTLAHIRYYTSLPDVFRVSSIYQILFGYGEGCSGYLMGILFDQYTDLSSWAVECDVVNILISNGVIGFILFYSWLLKIAIKGRKIDKRYFTFIIALIICGITYNVQNDWVIIVEMFMALTIKLNWNFFDIGMKLNKNRNITLKYIGG